MIRIFKDTFGCILGAFLFSGISVSVSGQSEVLVHWRFEQIQHLNGDSTSVSIVGQGVQAEQICYSTAKKITGPWTYGGFVTSSAKHGFTIHPSVIEFKGQWYFFYHDGAYALDGTPGGDCRRQVCVEYLYFNKDGSIKPITLTTEGVSITPKN